MVFFQFINTISYLPLRRPILQFFPLGMKKKYALYPKKSFSFPTIPSIGKKILLNTYHAQNFFKKYITIFTLMINITYPVKGRVRKNICSYIVFVRQFFKARSPPHPFRPNLSYFDQKFTNVFKNFETTFFFIFFLTDIDVA